MTQRDRRFATTFALLVAAFAACIKPNPKYGKLGVDAAVDGPSGQPLTDAAVDGPSDSGDGGRRGDNGGGCLTPIACPTPAAGKQTICGQIYNFADSGNTPFAASGATGMQCAAGATEGPCGLGILAVNPASGDGSPIYKTGAVYIDDCGRYRVPDIESAGTPFVVLKIDDTGDLAKPAPSLAGRTVPTYVGIPVSATRTKGFDVWIVNQSVTDKWKADGGPDVSATSGAYVGIFRAHACDATTGICPGGDRLATQAGAVISGANIGPKFYFAANDPGHQNISAGATATGINGVAITSVTAALTALNATGGIADTNACKWELHTAGMSSGGVFFQVYRPMNNGSQPCTQ